MRISRLLLVFAACYPVACATRSLLPGDAERGSALFRSLNCIVCHSVNGVGGKQALDFGQVRDRGFSPSDMAALMWNHAPAMWVAMAKQGLERPALNEQQAADLFVFLYQSAYFDMPGNAKRGKQLFLARRCGQCHGIESAVRPGIRPVAEWDSLWDQISLAHQMWSHARDMVQAFVQSDVPYPEVTAQELTDLLAWVRSARRQSHTTGSAPASPEDGRTLLGSKGCTGCHRGERTLEARRTRYSLTDFAAALWNHPLRVGSRHAPMSQEEMRRVAGYLVATQFFEERGDPDQGGRVFAKKRCGACHDNPASGAPARSMMLGRMTSLGIVAALWQHGPVMLTAMQRRNIPWPRFKGPEMADVSAYLHGFELKRRTSP